MIPLPEGPFPAILADPPWHFKCWSGGGNRHPDNHYATQGEEWIASLPVASVSADDCALFLWCCNPQLPEALRVIEAWGFEYKTVAFTWAKVNKDGTGFMGLGKWTRANSELCLLATRGHPKRLNADVPQLVLERRREHSRKPDCVRGRIERLVAGPYLEMFARKSAPGWTVWGNETDKFDPSDAVLVPSREGSATLFEEAPDDH